MINMFCEKGHIYHGTRCLICQSKLYRQEYRHKNRGLINEKSRIRRMIIKLYDSERYEHLCKKKERAV